MTPETSWGTQVGARTHCLDLGFFLGSIMETLESVYPSEDVLSTVARSKSVVNIALHKSDNETQCAIFMDHKKTLLNERTLRISWSPACCQPDLAAHSPVPIWACQWHAHKDLSSHGLHSRRDRI